MLFNIQRIDSKKNKGFLLPCVLGILVVIIFLSTNMGQFLLEKYKSLNISSSKDYSFELAQTTLEAVEEQINTHNSEPEIIKSNLNQENIISIFNNKVWDKDLFEYNKMLNKDPFSNNDLTWWQQPKTWWKKYTHQMVSPQISDYLLDKGNAYAAVEYIGPYQFNGDFVVAEEYGKGFFSQVYRITVAAYSNTGTRTILTSTFVKTYPK